MNIPASFLQLRTELKSNNSIELSLTELPTPEPGENEVLIRIEATPINPSDLGLLLAGADLATAKQGGTAQRPVIAADVGEAMMRAAAARVDQSLPAGNEGAGVVVKAGSAPEAQALLGKTVAMMGGAMYAQYRCVPAKICLELSSDTTPREGASCFVNPLTVLGMVETMRLENHTALAHTAAASNLGQMLQKHCLAEGVDLVNIVRKPEQEELLRGIGAKYVCNSSKPSFGSDLTEALVATGATLAFDATGGGTLANQILHAMEVAASRNATDFTRYGSTTHKQVYIYGGLDRSETLLARTYGMAWGLGGWLMPNFLSRVGPKRTQELREKVAAEIKTTFASAYTREVSLVEALQLDSVATYGRQATGEKYLINPSL
jgi:NADPH:quinone reductase-like Zn-dependent oxidoreductase